SPRHPPSRAGWPGSLVLAFPVVGAFLVLFVFEVLVVLFLFLFLFLFFVLVVLVVVLAEVLAIPAAFAVGHEGHGHGRRRGADADQPAAEHAGALGHQRRIGALVAQAFPLKRKSKLGHRPTLR